MLVVMVKFFLVTLKQKHPLYEEFYNTRNRGTPNNFDYGNNCVAG